MLAFTFFFFLIEIQMFPIITPRTALAMESVRLKMEQRLDILRQIVGSSEFAKSFPLSGKEAKVFVHADNTLSCAFQERGDVKNPPNESVAYYIFVFPHGFDPSVELFVRMYETRDYLFMHHSREPAEGIASWYGLLYKAARTSGAVLEPKKTEFVTFDL